jgi:hypothetical protein
MDMASSSLSFSSFGDEDEDEDERPEGGGENAPSGKYDGYTIKYECDSNKITYATITKGNKEFGKIKVGQDDKLNIPYQNSDEFAKIIFKENAFAVQTDIKRIYDDNVSKMKNIDFAMAEFYKKYGIFVSPPAEKSIYYIKPFGKFTSATRTAINNVVLIGLSNILLATGIDPNEKDNIIRELQEKQGGKTRNRKRHRRRTMRKRQTL